MSKKRTIEKPKQPRDAKKGGSGTTRFRPYFTTRNGKRIYARDYGYDAWPIG